MNFSEKDTVVAITWGAFPSVSGERLNGIQEVRGWGHFRKEVGSSRQPPLVTVK